MRNYIQFSVGEYELANFAKTQSLGGGGSFWSATKKESPSPTAGPDGKPVYGPPAPKPAPKARVDKKTVYGPPAPKEIYGPPRSAAPKQGKGIRKSHIRKVGGKAVTVGQSIIKAGQSTAGALKSAITKSPKAAAWAGGGVAGAALAGGAGYLATRKKRRRRQRNSSLAGFPCLKKLFQEKVFDKNQRSRNMEMTLEQAIAYLSDADLEDNEIDQVDEFVICCAQQKMGIEEIMDAEEDGEIDPEEADAAIAQIITEGAQRHLDIFDLEIEPIEMGADTSEYISFSQATGNVLAGLIEQEYQTPQDGIAAIMGATGLEQNEVQSIISGQSVPDTSTASAIASVFDTLQQDNEFKQWIDLTSNAYSETTQAQPEGSTPELVAMSAELDRVKADFAAQQQQMDLAQSLRVLERQASDLVAEGCLTPYEKKQLFGNEAEKEDSVALFSQVCLTNNVPTSTQLDRVQYYLHVAQGRGQVVQFGETQDEDSYEAVEDHSAQEYASEFAKRNGIIQIQPLFKLHQSINQDL